MLSATIYNFPK